MSSPVSLPKITVTIGNHHNILREIEDIEMLTQDSEGDQEYWKDIKAQMIKIAKLTYQTDQFMCCCGKLGCPFHSSGSIPSFYDIHENLPRRFSEPFKKDVSYGGLEPIFKASESDVIVEMEDDSNVAAESAPFQRRTQIRRGRRNSPLETKISASPPEIAYRTNTCRTKNNHKRLSAES
jgi:hypothetical protein